MLQVRPATGRATVDAFLTPPAVRPVADFTAAPLVGATPLTVPFTNQSVPTRTILAYAYDPAGNRTAMTETVNSTVVTTYTYNAANQLATARSSDDGITWSYAFDANGNLVEVTPNGTTPALGALRYTYDQASRLTTVENHNGSAYQPQASMVYDGAGQRLRITTWQGALSITSTFVVDSLARDAVLAATANGQTTYYLYGSEVIAEQTAAWAYYLKDGQATVRQLTDATAAVTLLRSYDPFGQVLVQQGTGNLAWGYFGGLLDAATGLIYFGNGLYYDPVTGRFLTPGGSGPNPYVPASRADPSGAMLGAVAVLALLARRRRARGKSDYWLAMLIVLLGLSTGLAACGDGEETPVSPPPGTPPTPNLPTEPPPQSGGDTQIPTPIPPPTDVATECPEEPYVEALTGEPNVRSSPTTNPEYYNNLLTTLKSNAHAKVIGQFGRQEGAGVWWWQVRFLDTNGKTVEGWVRSDKVSLVGNVHFPTPRSWISPFGAGVGWDLLTKWCSPNGDQRDVCYDDQGNVASGHYGIDITSNADPGEDLDPDKDKVAGREVYAMADGFVLFADTSASNYWINMLHEHPNGNIYWTQYTHLPSAESGVTTGGFVGQGTKLGYYSQVGISSGPHLHITIKRVVVEGEEEKWLWEDPTPLVP